VSETYSRTILCEGKEALRTSTMCMEAGNPSRTSQQIPTAKNSMEGRNPQHQANVNGLLVRVERCFTGALAFNHVMLLTYVLMKQVSCKACGHLLVDATHTHTQAQTNNDV
jgi:hypothetical protein